METNKFSRRQALQATAVLGISEEVREYHPRQQNIPG